MLFMQRHRAGHIIFSVRALGFRAEPRRVYHRVEKCLPIRRHYASHHTQNEYEQHKIAYRYLPLNGSSTNSSHIRLLELLPGCGSEPITSKLKDVNLADDLQYEAISYCWGDPKDTGVVSCDEQIISVPRRLELALRNMRHPNKSRLLWADAICINQADNVEKEIQVQLMRKIFSRAQRTLIWIGDVTERQQQKISKFALLTIKFGLFMLRRQLNQIRVPGVPILNVDEGTTKTLAAFSSDFYLELIGLLRMPWFQRAWVVQEVAVSSKATIFWGSFQYEWDDIVQALKFMSEVDFPLAFIVTLEHISAIEEERKFYRNGYNRLYSVLLRHQRCLATDLRDKIYSFSGLVETSSRPQTPIHITYNDDVTSVYRRTALDILKTDQNLDLLCRPPRLTISSLKGLPSWVPDWSTSHSSTLTYAWGHGPLSLAGTELGEHRRFKTAKASKFKPQTVGSGHTLEIEGYEIDKITSISPIFQGVQVPYTVRSFPDIVREWLNCAKTLLRGRKVFKSWQELASVRSKTMYPFSGETMREAFLQTVSTAEIEDHADVEIELRMWEKSSRRVIGIPYAAWVLVWHFVSNKPFLLFAIQGRYSLQRRMIRTESGYLGLASGTSEVGDSVVIAKGSSVPLIIRKAERGTWVLVGDSYVHGIMNGEAFQEDKCHRILIS